MKTLSKARSARQSARRTPRPQNPPKALSVALSGQGATSFWPLPDKQRSRLAEGWLLFRDGDWKTIPEYLAAFNKRFGTRRYSTNFKAQFTKPWGLLVNVPAKEVEKVKAEMRHRRFADRKAYRLRRPRK